MELNNVTKNSNIAIANLGRKKSTAGPWLMHFFRLGKMCMCQIQMTEIQVGIGKFIRYKFQMSHEPNRHEPNIKLA